jgi:polar amino acid transport system permease protein
MTPPSVSAENNGSRESLSFPMRALHAVLAIFIVTGLFVFSFQQLAYHWNWAAVYKYRAKFLQGWMVTVLISVTALVASTIIGFVFAFARRSRVVVVRYLSRIYVELIRGTPLLVQILIFFYVVAESFDLAKRYIVGVITHYHLAGA